jgi:hypothetical protein
LLWSHTLKRKNEIAGNDKGYRYGRWAGHRCDTISLAVHISRNTTIFLAILSAYLLFPHITFAHPGRTDGNGGHTCRTNCASWGLADGEYHSHGGSSNSSGGSSGDSYATPLQETVQTQEVVALPTFSPIPTRIPTRLPTRIPTKRPTPTVTVALTLTTPPTPTIEPIKKAQALRSSVNAQKEQGFFGWLFKLLGLR